MAQAKHTSQNAEILRCIRVAKAQLEKAAGKGDCGLRYQPALEQLQLDIAAVEAGLARLHGTPK